MREERVAKKRRFADRTAETAAFPRCLKALQAEGEFSLLAAFLALSRSLIARFTALSVHGGKDLLLETIFEGMKRAAVSKSAVLSSGQVLSTSPPERTSRGGRESSRAEVKPSSLTDWYNQIRRLKRRREGLMMERLMVIEWWSEEPSGEQTAQLWIIPGVLQRARSRMELVELQILVGEETSW